MGGGTMDGAVGGDEGNSNQDGDNNQGGDHGGSDGMPPPEDAPRTTDTITAGGGSNDDDDNDDSDEDEDNDNDKDDPQIPEDAPATTDALTAKKLECPPGQEVTLFSTTCGPAGADGTQGATSAAIVCPTSPTPTSYDISNGLSVTNAVWGPNSNNDFEIKTKQQSTPETELLHRTATPVRPGLSIQDAFKDPATRAVCTGEPVTVANPDGSNDVYGPDGSRTNILVNKDTGNSKVIEYNANGKTTIETKIEHLTGEPVQTVTDEHTSGRITATVYDTDYGNPTQVLKYDPISRLVKVDFYDPKTKMPTEQKVEDPNSGTRLVTDFVPGSDKPATTTLIDMKSDLLIMMIKYKEDGVTPAETIHYDEGANPLAK